MFLKKVLNIHIKTTQEKNWCTMDNIKIYSIKISKLQKYSLWASPVAQWWRTHQPVWGTQVRSLVPEDPTCHRATEPMGHSYWSLPALELALPNKRSLLEWEAHDRNYRVSPTPQNSRKAPPETKTQHSQHK